MSLSTRKHDSYETESGMLYYISIIETFYKDQSTT